MAILSIAKKNKKMAAYLADPKVDPLDVAEMVMEGNFELFD